MPTKNPQEMPSKGKLFAFDVGTKTYGLAVCDSQHMIASPLKTLSRGKWKQDKQTIQALVAEHNVVGAVVGMPLHMTGDMSPRAQAAQAFAELFEELTDLPVLLWDERLTTKAAEAALFEQRTGRQTRASKRDVKQQVDSVAASLILQSATQAIQNAHNNA